MTDDAEFDAWQQEYLDCLNSPDFDTARYQKFTEHPFYERMLVEMSQEHLAEIGKRVIVRFVGGTRDGEVLDSTCLEDAKLISWVYGVTKTGLVDQVHREPGGQNQASYVEFVDHKWHVQSRSEDATLIEIVLRYDGIC